MATVDYQGPAPKEQIPTTRCPKCGGLKRGVTCPSCKSERRDAFGGRILSILGAVIAVAAIGVLGYFSPGLASGAFIALISFFVITAAVRAGKK